MRAARRRRSVRPGRAMVEDFALDRTPNDVPTLDRFVSRSRPRYFPVHALLRFARSDSGSRDTVQHRRRAIPAFPAEGSLSGRQQEYVVGSRRTSVERCRLARGESVGRRRSDPRDCESDGCELRFSRNSRPADVVPMSPHLLRRAASRSCCSSVAGVRPARTGMTALWRKQSPRGYPSTALLLVPTQ